MDWIATPESSNLAGFGYEPKTLTLTVEFNNGGRYNYFEVPEQVYAGLRGASSKGQYLAQEIKNRFRYARA